MKKEIAYIIVQTHMTPEEQADEIINIFDKQTEELRNVIDKLKEQIEFLTLNIDK